MKILQQRHEAKQLEIELEHKRLLCEVEAKWKKIIENLYAKRHAADAEHDDALSE